MFDVASFNMFAHEVMVLDTYAMRHEKTNILVSDLVRHKPGCTATVDG